MRKASLWKVMPEVSMDGLMGVSQERSLSGRTNSRQSRQEIIMICGKDFRYSGIARA